MLGDRVAGREELLRRTLAEGHELGNHAFHHERLAGRPLAAYRQLRRTSAAIRAATGSSPVVFRAPYGAVSDGVVRTAGLLGMSTVGWDVDPRDYELPSAEEIHARVVDGVRADSIVVLHDERRAGEQTVTALATILVTLGARGYSFVTASELPAVRPPPRWSARRRAARRRAALRRR